MTDISAPPSDTHAFTLILSGKGAHAARPHEGLDAIVTGSHIIAALAAQCSRGGQRAGVAVMAFQAGNSWNVLPPEAQISGILYAEDAAHRHALQQQTSRLITTLAQAFGLQAQLTWQPHQNANLHYTA